MRNLGKAAVRNLRPVVVWVCACLGAVVLVEQNALAGLVLAMLAGIVVGILLWR